MSYQYYVYKTKVTTGVYVDTWAEVVTELAVADDLAGVAQISLITWESGDDGSVQGE